MWLLQVLPNLTVVWQITRKAHTTNPKTDIRNCTSGAWFSGACSENIMYMSASLKHVTHYQGTIKAQLHSHHHPFSPVITLTLEKGHNCSLKRETLAHKRFSKTNHFCCDFLVYPDSALFCAVEHVDKQDTSSTVFGWVNLKALQIKLNYTLHYSFQITKICFIFIGILNS